MKTKIAILTIAAAVLSLSGGVAVAADAEGTYTVFGEGNGSCAKFLRHEKESKVQHNYDISWIQGFITARGRYHATQKELGDIADGDGIAHLVRKHCEENPLDDLDDAAEYVVRQLIDRAGRR